jgi:hypothetical protein
VASLAVAALAAALLLLSGCASVFGSSDADDDFDVEQAEIATSALPSTRDVSHHPDSLTHLQLVEKNGRIEFELDGSYRKLLLEWTAGKQQRRSYFRTHATLWSKELSLASLIPERGIQGLSKDLARDMIRERTAEYDSLLQIDVYLFAPSKRRVDLRALQLDGPGRRVYLRDGEDRTYEPVRIESTAPMEAFRASRQTLYGRNAVFFERYTDDGRDLLDAEWLRLYARTGFNNTYFTWNFLDKSDAVVSSTGSE